MFPEKFSSEQRVIALNNLAHGDWKTALVHKERYPLIPKGTEIKVIETWDNLYGRWVKVEGPNGSHYDVRENQLKSI